MKSDVQSTMRIFRVTRLILLVFAFATLSLAIPERSPSAASGPGFDLGTVAKKYHFKLSGQSVEGQQFGAIGWFEADATGVIIAGNIEGSSLLGGGAIMLASIPLANGSGRFVLLDDTNGIYRLTLLFENAQQKVNLDMRVLLDDPRGRSGSISGLHTALQFSLSAVGVGLGEIVSQ